MNGHKYVTQARFIKHCMKMKGACLASVTYVTKPPLIKPKTTLLDRKPIDGRIEKRCKVNVVLNFHYEGAVNRQRNREADEADKVPNFTAQSRKWGERVKKSDGTYTPLVKHKGQYYLEVKVQKVINTQYMLDGTIVPKEQIAVYLRERNGESGRQDVDKPIIIRDIKVLVIEQVSIDGEIWTIRG